MNIGIIGAGNVGGTLAQLWTAAGHRVMLSFSREESRLRRAALNAGDNASFGIVRDAVQFADVVLFAPPFPVANDALRQAGELRDVLVIDATNPFSFAEPEKRTGPLERIVGEDTTGFKVLRAAAPSARWAKAFSTLQPSALVASMKRPSETRVVVPFVAPDGPSRVLVSMLIRDAGGVPFEVGSAEMVKHLEIPGRFSLSDDLSMHDAIRRLAALGKT